MTPEEYQQALAQMGSPLQLVETTDVPVPEGADSQFLARVTEVAEKSMQARLDKMSPVGALRLRSRLLERRRLEHRITDAHFKCQAAFDHIYVKQIEGPETAGDSGSPIFLTDVAQTRERQNTFKGIIVSAGLKALDELRSNGIDLGHEIWFVKHVSARFEVETVDGRMEYLLCLAVGDIKGSVDMAAALREGELEIEAAFDNNGAPEHRIKLRNPETGEFTPTIKRLNPWISEDV